MKRHQAGCVLSSAHAQKLNKTSMCFSTRAKFIIEHSKMLLLVKSFLCGMMNDMYSILEYLLDIRACPSSKILKVIMVVNYPLQMFK